MNPHAIPPAGPWQMIQTLWYHRALALGLTRRDISSRYRGSMLGLAWSFVTPLLMLGIYTFVFSVVFKAKWGMDTGPATGIYALNLFAGLIVHGLMAEVLTRTPSLILAHANYVKKVRFPLEILPLIPLGAALFHAAIALVILLAAQLLLTHSISWTVLFAPLVLAPLVILAAGFGWLLASLGVFLRDIGQAMGMLVTALLFLSPVFYPPEALPHGLYPVLIANPLTFIIEQLRWVVLQGGLPHWGGLAAYTLVAFAVASIGFAWFQKTRKGFADVL